MRRICDYFGVESHEIIMPTNEFEQIIKRRDLSSDQFTRKLRQHIEHIFNQNDPRLVSFTGLFFEYYYSMSSRGKIVRALVIVTADGNNFYYRRLERMGPSNRACGRHYRYQGTALMTGDRIFLNDYEYSAGIEITQTVLYPDYSHKWTRLYGVKIGVSANRDHVPCCVRTYLERLMPSMSTFAALRRCGLFDSDSFEIPKHILHMIDNSQSGPDVFEAFSDGQR